MVKLSIFVPKAAAERVLVELLEVSPNGFEEVEHRNEVEYVLYGAPGELPTLPALQAVVGDVLVRVESHEIADDWHERWKAFHQPLTIAEKLHVRAPWHASPADDLLDIVIDPGRAFGTGSHPTTRLCLELLLACKPDGGLMDLGCGSGVLAIAACKLGFGPVTGVDYDELCIAATSQNAANNKVDLELGTFDLRSNQQAPSAQTLVANLMRPLLLQIAASGFAGSNPQRAILSGLLIEEAGEVADAFAKQGLLLRKRTERDGWCALLLEAR